MQSATPCSLCARLRRGVLYRLATEVGATKIALGHHLDDFIETLLLNLFFAGALKAMPARLVSDNGQHVVIRPLVYVTEGGSARTTRRTRRCRSSAAAARRAAISSLQRQRVKRLIAELEVEHPEIKNSMIRALANVASRHLLDTTAESACRSCATRRLPAALSPLGRCTALASKLSAVPAATAAENVLMNRVVSDRACVLAACAGRRPPQRAAAAARHRRSGDDRRRPRPARRRLRSAARRILSRRPGSREPAARADARRQLRHQLDRRAADRRRLYNRLVDHVARGRRRCRISSTSPATRRTTSRTSSSRPRFGCCRGDAGPAGVRRAVRDEAPNASNESGLGLDTTDFYVSGLFGKTVQSVRVVGNVGLGILGDPVRGDRQNDVLTYGLSIARAVRQGLEVVGEDQRPARYPRGDRTDRDREPRRHARRRPLHAAPCGSTAA